MLLLPKRRWLSFSVRTLLVAVTICCVWLGWQVAIVRERKALMAELTQGGGAALKYDGVQPFDVYLMEFDPMKEDVGAVRRVLGDEAYVFLLLPLPPGALDETLPKDLRQRFEEQAGRFRKAFPEVESMRWKRDDLEPMDQTAGRIVLDMWYSNIDEWFPLYDKESQYWRTHYGNSKLLDSVLETMP